MKPHSWLTIGACVLFFFNFFNVSSALAVTAVTGVARYDGTTGEFLGIFAKSDLLVFPTVPTFGPDGNLYVPHSDDAGGGNVLRFNGNTGAFIDVFADDPAIVEPPSAVFGPTDRNLYVLNNIGGEVTRFDGSSGAFIDVFTSGGFFRANQHIFGPDGNIYISEQSSTATDPGMGVYQYDGNTGAFIDVFTSGGPQEEGLFVGGLTFGPDKNLYVADRGLGLRPPSVLRYDGTTGAFIDVFASGGILKEPFYPTFGPCSDTDGMCLYLNNFGTDGEILQYDGVSGDFIGVFASSDQIDPSFISGAAIFGPDGDLYRSGRFVPLPAAVWLFASGLLGLVGMARWKKAA